MPDRLPSGDTAATTGVGRPDHVAISTGWMMDTDGGRYEQLDSRDRLEHPLIAIDGGGGAGGGMSARWRARLRLQREARLALRERRSTRRSNQETSVGTAMAEQTAQTA